MTNEEAKKKLKAKSECFKREISGINIDCLRQNCDECNLLYEQGNLGEQTEALDIAVEALELVKNFETAQIITGGRLNGRTHAYKCGLADGQRLAKGEVIPQQKTGRWRHYEYMLICSECGAEYYDDIMEYCGNDVPKYCPNCGADMREREVEE